MAASLATIAQAGRWTGWLVSGAVALALVTTPISVDTQLALSLAAIAAMTGLWLAGRGGALARMAFIAVSSLVILRYMYWRVTSTLPDIADPISFGLGLVLIAAELYCATMLAISLVINAEPMRREPLIAEDGPDLPRVDVFIPTYNEDEVILAVTVAAARAMDYPAEKLTVWLLDDGGSDQKCADADPAKAAAAKARRASLQGLCDELGAVYSTRARNEHAKAGNLNHGLAKSTGDLVVVFDADHAPFRSFLRETVGYFAADPRLFLVQTPHVFLNPDPIEKNLGTFARMPSENEMFYGVTQRGLDKWNGSFFCGSAALLRRTALAETGGFSGITITEDCESAFELHARGWTSVFVDKPLIAGLQPETFADFIGQRSRWCQGMFQIMLLKNPAFKPGLKMIQRLAYMSSMTFWFFPIPRLIFMLAPLLHIFLDVKIFDASVDESIAYTATYMVVNVMLQNFLYGHVRWPWVSELYEYVQGVFLAKAIGSVVMSPRRPTFNVTAKGQSLDHDHLSKLAWPFVAIFAALALGVATAAYRYAFEAGVTNLMLVVGLWALFNLVIAGAALGAVAERRQPDRHPRLAVDRRLDLAGDGPTLAARAVSVSASGCALRLPAPTPEKLARLEASQALSLLIPAGRGDGPALRLGIEIVRVERREAGEIELGCAFRLAGHADYRGVASLMYGEADAMAAALNARRSHKSLLSGTLEFLRWAVTGPVQALVFYERERRRLAALPAAPAIEAVQAEPAPAAEAPSFRIPSMVGRELSISGADQPAAASDHLLLAVANLLSVAAEPARPAVAPGLVGPVSSEWLRRLVTLAQEELDAAPAEAPITRAPSAEWVVARSAGDDEGAWLAAILGLDAAVTTPAPASGEALAEPAPERAAA